MQSASARGEYPSTDSFFGVTFRLYSAARILVNARDAFITGGGDILLINFFYLSGIARTFYNLNLSLSLVNRVVMYI